MSQLDPHQQALVNIVKAAHNTLAVARKTRSTELARRNAEAKIEAERFLEEKLAQIKVDLDAEVVQHEAALDESIITAYNNGVPIRRIALDGFGNRYDGGVNQLIVKLRNDGRLGSRTDYQRNTGERQAEVHFPKPVNVDEYLNAATTVAGPIFERVGNLVLVPANDFGEEEITVPAVKLTMDIRDPYFKRIHQNARPGTPYANATTATLYIHPATGELMTQESRETGDVTWDHPVARWVKDNPAEARAGFDSAVQ